MTAVVLRADLTEQTIALAEHEGLVAHQAAAPSSASPVSSGITTAGAR